MTASRTQAIAASRAVQTYPVGMCARFTRECFGVPALGDFDGDGDADAIDQWAAARIKNEGDRNPPGGVPAYFAGGSKGHGHAVVTLPDRPGLVRSIDMSDDGLRYQPGNVGTTTIADIERVMGLNYLGWSEDLYGYVIPDPEGDAARAAAALRLRRLEKLAATRKRRAKWQRWVKKANANIARLKGLTKP